MSVSNGKDLAELLIEKGYVNARGGVDRSCSFELFGITSRQLANWLSKETFNSSQQKIINLQSGKEAVKLLKFVYPTVPTTGTDMTPAVDDTRLVRPFALVSLTEEDLR